MADPVGVWSTYFWTASRAYNILWSWTASKALPSLTYRALQGSAGTLETPPKDHLDFCPLAILKLRPTSSLDYRARHEF